jgi:hypothetical protein
MTDIAEYAFMQNMGTMDDVASPWMQHWGLITLLLLDERTVL